MDRVFIEGLEVDTVIGAYDWERDIRQCLRLDLSFAWDNRPAAAGDDLSLALDYASVSARIQAFSEQARFELVETFAERLVAVLMEEFRTGGQELTKLSADLEGQIRTEFEAQGVTFHEADIGAYREATAGFFTSFPAWPEGLYDQVRAAATGN